ncbi:hypothetical protein D3C81_1663450 [compost metagenome]
MGECLLAGIPVLLVGVHGLQVVDVEEDVLFGTPSFEGQATDFSGIAGEGDIDAEHFVGGALLRREALQSNPGSGGEQQRDGAKGNAEAGTNFQAG